MKLTGSERGKLRTVSINLFSGALVQPRCYRHIARYDGERNNT